MTLTAVTLLPVRGDHHVSKITGAAGTFVIALAVCLPARGNDGFYQGAGAQLIPVKSAAVRVLREALVIAPVHPPTCANVLYRGKPVEFPDAWNEPPMMPAEPDHSAFALGPPRPCGKEHNARRQLVALWQAEATYSVEALAPATDVLIGFPVPTWDFEYYTPDGLDAAPLPAVTRFDTFIDGRREPSVEVRDLELPAPRVVESREEGTQVDKTLGYVWRTSFRKGVRRTLRSTYEFGEDVSDHFYSGYRPAGQDPWFLSGWKGRQPGARKLLYYLTPIRTWAEPPPDEIRIRVDLPEDRPVTVFVPVHLRPHCVDEHAFHFSLAKRFPDTELAISYPDSLAGLPRLETPAQWSAWKATLGGDAVQLTCRLRDRLAADTGGPLRTIVQNTACVPACERAGP